MKKFFAIFLALFALSCELIEAGGGGRRGGGGRGDGRGWNRGGRGHWHGRGWRGRGWGWRRPWLGVGYWPYYARPYRSVYYTQPSETVVVQQSQPQVRYACNENDDCQGLSQQMNRPYACHPTKGYCVKARFVNQPQNDDEELLVVQNSQ